MTEAAQRYLLVDTFTKDGRGLLDWLDVPELEAIIQHASQVGRQVVFSRGVYRRTARPPQATEFVGRRDCGARRGVCQ